MQEKRREARGEVKETEGGEEMQERGKEKKEERGRRKEIWFREEDDRGEKNRMMNTKKSGEKEQ